MRTKEQLTSLMATKVMGLEKKNWRRYEISGGASGQIWWNSCDAQWQTRYGCDFNMWREFNPLESHDDMALVRAKMRENKWNRSINDRRVRIDDGSVLRIYECLYYLAGKDIQGIGQNKDELWAEALAIAEAVEGNLL